MDDTHTKHGPSPEENPAVSYERSDLDIFAVTKFGIGLAIGTVAAVFMMWGLFEWFQRQTPADDMPPAMAEARKALIPPEPRLQSMGTPLTPDVEQGALRSPHVELSKFRQDEAMQLDSFAWVDPNKGIVRVPIEVAKELVLKKAMLTSKVSAEGKVVAITPNPGEGVGTSSAAQPQRVYETGAAAVGSAPVTRLPEPERSEVENVKPPSAEKK